MVSAKRNPYNKARAALSFVRVNGVGLQKDTLLHRVHRHPVGSTDSWRRKVGVQPVYPASLHSTPLCELQRSGAKQQ